MARRARRRPSRRIAVRVRSTTRRNELPRDPLSVVLRRWSVGVEPRWQAKQRVDRQLSPKDRDGSLAKLDTLPAPSAPVVLDDARDGIDERHVGERRDLTVQEQLRPAVVLLRRVREHLDEQRRVLQAHAVLAGDLPGATRDACVGVRVELRGVCHADALVAVEDVIRQCPARCCRARCRRRPRLRCGARPLWGFVGTSRRDDRVAPIAVTHGIEFPSPCRRLLPRHDGRYASSVAGASARHTVARRPRRESHRCPTPIRVRALTRASTCCC